MSADGRDDDLESRIDRWEELRGRLGRDASHSMVSFLNSEIDRPRLNKLGADRDRASDGPPPPEPAD